MVYNRYCDITISIKHILQSDDLVAPIPLKAEPVRHAEQLSSSTEGLYVFSAHAVQLSPLK